MSAPPSYGQHAAALRERGHILLGGVGEALRQLEGELLERMRNELRVTPAITWLEPETLPRTGKKTDFFERNYR